MSKMADGRITPVATLKRKLESSTSTDYSFCLFCQETKRHPLHEASEDGKIRVKEVAAERESLADRTFLLFLNRLTEIPDDDWCNRELIRWHKPCYIDFASDSRMVRVRKKASKASYRVSEGASNLSDDQVPEPSARNMERKKMSPMDWSKCMICQDTDRPNLRNIMTMNTSNKILKLSQGDFVMRVRTAGVIDLVAAEGKYHTQCLVELERRMDKQKDDSNNSSVDFSLQELTHKLLCGLTLGHVYDMGTVWDLYLNIAAENQTMVPDSFMSRRTTFYDALQRQLGDEACFIRPLQPKSPLLLYPSDKSKFVIANYLTKVSEDDLEMSEEDAGDNQSLHCPIAKNHLQDIVHSALLVRSELESSPGHKFGWTGLNKDAVAAIIPDSLYLFLSVLFGGTGILDSEDCEDDQVMKGRVLNIAQDIVFSVSKGRKLTPKHIGLGLTLHHTTRSEKLVDLFHAAGDSVSMDTIRRIDTHIANNILQKYEENNNVFVPEVLVPYEQGRIILGSADNLDVIEDTIGGQGTFHCTQWSAWQRGPPPSRPAMHITHGRDRALKKELIEALHDVDAAKLPHGTRVKPIFETPAQIKAEQWFDSSPSRNEAKVMNDTWIMARLHGDGNQKVPPWSMFNEVVSEDDPEVTTVGMAPILNAPADTYSTITTIINRFVQLTQHLGQNHAVLFFDQPLYSKAKELVWAAPEKYGNVVVLLGDLHIAFNFLRAIGQQMESAGLDDIWVESGLFGQNSAKAMMEGKNYYRAVRGHIWAYEALCRIELEQFLAWLQERDEKLFEEINHLRAAVAEQFQLHGAHSRCDGILDAVHRLKGVAGHPELQKHMEEFRHLLKENPNKAFWLKYRDMVGILLDFIRANRDGNWQLHLDSFSAMLPWLTVYDHTNYARWGPVYLADMQQLPQTAPNVYQEFVSGNFVVKRHVGRFNQIPVDQATEWTNKICKVTGGIIGITRNDPARDKFCTTWSERSQIAEETYCLFGLRDEDADADTFSTRKDALPSRITQDDEAVQNLVDQFRRFKVFEGGTDTELLMSLASSDVGTGEITENLLTADAKGKKLVEQNVQERLVECTTPFFSPLKRQQLKTFADLYKCTVGKQKRTKEIKADRHLIQRLLNASRAGRNVDMADIMKHELADVPLSLAYTNRKMTTTAKSDLLPLLTEQLGIERPVELPATSSPTCLLIDGHALIQALGKPTKCKTFDAYANKFKETVEGYFSSSVTRVDVVFDQYRDMSIKSGTRTERLGQKKPIRKVISRGDLALPEVWTNFLALGDNKQDLANFLTKKLAVRTDSQKRELVSGGSSQGAISTTRGPIPELAADHEEADTRLILHALEAVKSGYKRIVVKCRDTDVLLMLIHFLGAKAEVWMLSETSRDTKCYPAHTISQKLEPEVVENLLGFHAVTGCDSVSSFAGYGKKSCWVVFLQHPELLRGVGRDGTVAEVEQFVCHLYGAPDVAGGCDEARRAIFELGKKSLELLPPTTDALELHVSRANFQAKIWLQADRCHMSVGNPADSEGWEEKNGVLRTVLTRKPSVPKSCLELVTCKCEKNQCRTGACKCVQSGQICLPACGCAQMGCLSVFSVANS